MADSASISMKAFWRKEEFSKEESHLIAELLDAHYQSCFRDNASSVAIALTANASGELGKAIAAGIATMGGKHAPLEETVRFLSLEQPWMLVDSMLELGKKIPGWGGTFQKDKPDPLWVGVDALIERYQPSLHSKLEKVTACLKEHHKLLWPNPSAYTACVAIIMGMPTKLAPYLFIYGRLTGWTIIAAGHLGNT